ncbi:hypothetical protein B0H13DRAFT_1877308, partial [Mycena leptocephala]
MADNGCGIDLGGLWLGGKGAVWESGMYAAFAHITLACVGLRRLNSSLSASPMSRTAANGCEADPGNAAAVNGVMSREAQATRSVCRGTVLGGTIVAALDRGNTFLRAAVPSKDNVDGWVKIWRVSVERFGKCDENGAQAADDVAHVAGVRAREGMLRQMHHPGPQPIQGRSCRKAPDAAAAVPVAPAPRSPSLDPSPARPTPIPEHDRRAQPDTNEGNGSGSDIAIEDGGSAGEEGAMILDDEEEVKGDERREISPQRSRSHSPTRGRPQSRSRSPTPTHHRTAQTSPKRGHARERRGPPQYREPPPEIKAKEQEFERSRRFHPSATRTEDEEDFLKQVWQGEVHRRMRRRGAGKRRNRAGNRAGKGWQKQRERQDGARGSDVDDADDADKTHRSGPFSKELKKEADELGAEFKKNIAALAQKYGKDPQAVHRYLGSLTKAHREKNAWNLYQSWKSAPDGGNDVMPDDMEPQEWSAKVAADYKQALRDSGIEPDDKPDTAHIRGATVPEA